MDGYYGGRGSGTGGYQPRNIQEQVDAIVRRLNNEAEPMSAPGDGIAQAYAPAPQPRNWRDAADAIVAQLEREQAERAAPGVQVADNSDSGFGLIGPAQAQVAIPLPPPPIPGVPRNPDMGRQLIDFLAAMAADAQRKLGEANDAKYRRSGRSFQTYTKDNLDSWNMYSGRTSGARDPVDNVWRRGLAEYPPGNYDHPFLDCSSDSYGAIRGREQQLIDHYRSLNRSDNTDNGVSPFNPLRGYYLQQGLRECGFIPMRPPGPR